VKSQFERFRIRRINEQELLQATEDAKDSLTTKIEELMEIFAGATSDRALARSCQDLTVRIRSQANRIVNGLVSPVNMQAVSQGLRQIDSNILVLESRLCLHYEQIATHCEKDRMMRSCYKKALDLIRKYPPPVPENDFEEYTRVASGVNIEYSIDEGARLNNKLLQLPGLVNFLTSLTEIEKRNHVLGLIRQYDDNDSAAINPLPEHIRELLPCIPVLDFLNFSSEEELRRDFVRFFRNGNWLEQYIFLMIDRAGCSTRLLNATLSWDAVSLEADVLALCSNNLIIFEAKDRSFSDGLSVEDVAEIIRKVEKLANLGNANIKMNYVISVSDEHKEDVSAKIHEISSSKGFDAKTIFLDNEGAIDNIIAKIRMCLR